MFRFLPSLGGEKMHRTTLGSITLLHSIPPESTEYGSNEPFPLTPVLGILKRSPCLTFLPLTKGCLLAVSRVTWCIIASPMQHQPLCYNAQRWGQTTVSWGCICSLPFNSYFFALRGKNIILESTRCKEVHTSLPFHCLCTCSTPQKGVKPSGALSSLNLLYTCTSTPFG